MTDLLDGPGDSGDYVTVDGLEDWEVDMSLENFLRNARQGTYKMDRVA